MISLFAANRWIALQWSLNLAAVFSLLYLCIDLAGERDDAKEVLLDVFIVLCGIEFVIQLYQLKFNGSPRPSGTFFNPNFLAQFYSITILLSLGKLISDLRTKSGSGKLFCIVGICLGGMYFTASRGGFLSLFAGLVFFLLLKNRKALLIPILFLIIFLIFPNALKERFIGSTDIYSFSRIDIWLSTILIFLNNPLGIGVGNFQYYFPSQNFPVYDGFVLFARRAVTAHNEFLQVMVDQGVIGIVLCLFFVISLWIFLFKLYRHKKNDVFLASFMAALVSIGTHGMFDSVLHATALSSAAAIITGFLLWESRDFEKGSISLSKTVRALSLFLVIVFIFFSAKTFVGDLYYKKGVELSKEDTFSRGEKHLDMAEFFDPSRPSISESQAALNYRRFVRFRDRDSLRNAISKLGQGARKNPMNFKYYLRRANLKQLLLMEKSPLNNFSTLSDEILRDYRKALDINPYSVVTMKSMAEYLRKSGNVDGAVSILRKAISTEPNFGRARVLLGEIFMDGDRGIATWMFKTALANFEKFEGRKMTSYEREIIMIDRERVDEIISGLVPIK